ncbi:MAG: DUF1700 domain-containing protein [Defluviitaleaceae bacterium]|nr:DUF1700 domain-containing protein [Defluviitaleaceae bacterium]
MTKQEYLEQLRQKLQVIPESERNDALEYYDGYISDAVSEEIAMGELGSPGEVAAIILANYVSAEPEISGMKLTWVIILALFAIPVGLPLIIAIAFVPITLFLTLGTLIFSFVLTGGIMLVVGGAGLIITPFVAINNFGYALALGGTSLISIGIGILFIRFTAFMMRGFPMIARFVSRKISRRSGHGQKTL